MRLFGEASPLTKALWRLEVALRQLDDALLVFMGLASEWED
jgi:hypothetical protein